MCTHTLTYIYIYLITHTRVLCSHFPQIKFRLYYLSIKRIYYNNISSTKNSTGGEMFQISCGSHP